ncbi:AAA domain-containing protein, partial [Candidatus Bathyarchaeota archaeon]|nr:AAA domain-containing protein [Candidatus Bathyarchaeota archaeon]
MWRSLLLGMRFEVIEGTGYLPLLRETHRVFQVDACNDGYQRELERIPRGNHEGKRRRWNLATLVLHESARENHGRTAEAGKTSKWINHATERKPAAKPKLLQEGKTTSQATTRNGGKSRMKAKNTVDEWEPMEFPEHVASLIPEGVPHYFDEGNYFNSMLDAMEENHNVLIIGPTGTGKTHLVRSIAQALKLPMLEVSFTLGTDVTDIIGRYELKKGKTEWIYGPLPNAMMHGTIFYADEINMARPDVVSRLHPCLDDRRSIIVSEHEEELIKAHPRYRFIGAMNPVELGYAGTRPLSPALKRRFEEIIYINYPKKETELKILKSRARLEDEEILEKMIEVATKLRRAHEEGLVSSPPT